jgi:uncharacterized protein (DUF58 family)
MRLLVSAFILLATTLDIRFGAPNLALHVAGIATGVLLALTVIADVLWLAPPRRRPIKGRAAHAGEP